MRSQPKGTGRTFQITELREWAAANKIPVPQRGRIPEAIVQRYREAGGR